MASILKKFNSIAGYSVGDETPIDVIDANANVSANNLLTNLTCESNQVTAIDLRYNSLLSVLSVVVKTKFNDPNAS